MMTCWLLFHGWRAAANRGFSNAVPIAPRTAGKILGEEEGRDDANQFFLRCQ
jgi:hypothetical protein